MAVPARSIPPDRPATAGQSISFSFSAMASPCEIRLAGAARAQLAEAAALAIAEVRRIEHKYSRYRDDSVVTRINREAGRAEVAIDPETAALLRYADQCYRLSGTLFDITSGALRRAWDFRRTPPRLPTGAELEAAVSAIGWCDVEWSDHTIRLPRPGMEIDFGGICKEYAADRIEAVWQSHGHLSRHDVGRLMRVKHEDGVAAVETAHLGTRLDHPPDAGIAVLDGESECAAQRR